MALKEGSLVSTGLWTFPSYLFNCFIMFTSDHLEQRYFLAVVKVWIRNKGIYLTSAI